MHTDEIRQRAYKYVVHLANVSSMAESASAKLPPAPDAWSSEPLRAAVGAS